jgi:hypothetical protein
LPHATSIDHGKGELTLPSIPKKEKISLNPCGENQIKVEDQVVAGENGAASIFKETTNSNNNGKARNGSMPFEKENGEGGNKKKNKKKNKKNKGGRFSMGPDEGTSAENLAQ